MSRGDFWTRRRAAVEAEQQAEAAAVEAAQRAGQQRMLEEKTDDELLKELDLPDPDQSDSAEDLRCFLTEAVPQRLRLRALRRMWRLNPVLANLDGLVDYGEDFTDSATVIENMQTVYQVGKGMFDKLADAAAEAEEKAAAAASPVPDEDSATDRAEPGAAADEETVAQGTAPLPDTQPALTTPEAEMPAAAPRRMRFQFDTA